MCAGAIDDIERYGAAIDRERVAVACDRRD
jgi:hypothetical protein